MAAYPTARLKRLKISVSEITRLIRGVSSTAGRTRLQELKAQAFIILTHAAFEEYLEGLVRDVALEARDMYKKEGLITKALVCMIGTQIRLDVLERVAKRQSSHGRLIEDLEAYSEFAVSNLNTLLNSNNGIMEKDQNKMLRAIGVEPSEIDVVTMNNLHAHGILRSELAHKVSIINTELSTGDLRRRVEQITERIYLFDQEACKTLEIRMVKAEIK